MAAPSISPFGSSQTFAENSLGPEGVVFLGSAPTIRDAEGNFVGGSLHVSGLLPEDRVFIRNQGNDPGHIGVSGNEVSFGGTVFGTLHGGNGTPLLVEFNDHAELRAINALTQNLRYTNTSDTPTSSRVMVINLIDGSGADLGLIGSSTRFVQYPLGSSANMQLAGTTLASTSLVDIDGDGDKDLVGSYSGSSSSPATFAVWRNGTLGTAGNSPAWPTRTRPFMA